VNWTDSRGRGRAFITELDRQSNHNLVFGIAFIMSAPSTDRFPAWLALALFSAVCLAATETEKFAGTGGNRSAADKWVLSVEILSMTVAFFACVAYLFESIRERFVSKIPEISFVRTADTLTDIFRRRPAAMEYPKLTHFPTTVTHFSLCLL
jgi:hypothetical protein